MQQCSSATARRPACHSLLLHKQRQITPRHKGTPTSLPVRSPSTPHYPHSARSPSTPHHPPHYPPTPHDRPPLLTIHTSLYPLRTIALHSSLSARSPSTLPTIHLPADRKNLRFLLREACQVRSQFSLGQTLAIHSASLASRALYTPTNPRSRAAPRAVMAWYVGCAAVSSEARIARTLAITAYTRQGFTRLPNSAKREHAAHCATKPTLSCRPTAPLAPPDGLVSGSVLWFVAQAAANARLELIGMRWRWW